MKGSTIRDTKDKVTTKITISAWYQKKRRGINKSTLLYLKANRDIFVTIGKNPLGKDRTSYDRMKSAMLVR